MIHIDSSSQIFVRNFSIGHIRWLFFSLSKKKLNHTIIKNAQPNQAITKCDDCNIFA
ncbi:MAG: hypothetical protein WCG25_04415 [bacterium]